MCLSSPTLTIDTDTKLLPYIEVILCNTYPKFQNQSRAVVPNGGSTAPGGVCLLQGGAVVGVEKRREGAVGGR